MRHVLSPHNLARASAKYDLVPALRRDQQKSGTTSRTTHFSAIITTLVSYTFTNLQNLPIHSSGGSSEIPSTT
jgi:hypothetical protein